jgi:hypothetical protein
MISVDNFMKYETINNKMDYFCDMDSGYNESDKMDRQLLNIQRIPYDISHEKDQVAKDYITERKRFRGGENLELSRSYTSRKPHKNLFPTAQAIYEAHVEENNKLGLIERYRLIDDIMWGIFDWQESLKRKKK